MQQIQILEILGYALQLYPNENLELLSNFDWEYFICEFFDTNKDCTMYLLPLFGIIRLVLEKRLQKSIKILNDVQFFQDLVDNCDSRFGFYC